MTTTTKVTVVETYGREAMIEVLEILKDRQKKYGNCLISSQGVLALIRRNFGVLGVGAGILRDMIFDYLKSIGALESFSKSRRGSVYRLKLDL